MGSADQITIGRVSGFKEWIRITAQRFDLPPAILAGLVATESGGDPWAMRAEELYRYLVGDDPHEKLIKPPTSTQATEFYTQKLSWGLCQIMGATGRELRHQGWHSQMSDPVINLHYGAMYLARCLKRRGGDMRQALLLYNGGGDPEYPDKVLSWARLFEN